MNDALILSLGHGASAIFIKDGEVAEGYQLERLTGIKGDSRFPMLAIEQIMLRNLIPPGTPIYVSHWHPTGDVANMTVKHWSSDYIQKRFPSSDIISTNTYTTHHDTHAWSALAYNHMMEEGDNIMVADGFGTMGEVISIYRLYCGRPVLQRRLYGFEGSLGLLYQYGTDYVGWKQNQDEWKLNACANQCEDNRKMDILNAALSFTDEIIEIQTRRNIGADDPITSMGALSYTHASVVDRLKYMFEPTDRAGVAYFLQNVVEEVVKYWIRELGIKRCTFVGGCFLNVQLNGVLAEYLEEISVMPLSGDEGAGLGMYKYFNPDFIVPDNLCWGIRDLGDRDMTDVPGIQYTVNLAEDVEKYLSRGNIVNVIRGSMEYGPRAYCNTSTLALPTERNRAYINVLNDRNQVMPMCPVMTLDQYNEVFEPHPGIKRSIEHMIIAVPWKEEFADMYQGVKYVTADGTVTGRPQVVNSDHWIYDVLRRTGPLINTSFNNHGQPIVYSTAQILEAHKHMWVNDTEKRVITLIDISENNRS
jgi:predicted NodU family carbamoyl transferase